MLDAWYNDYHHHQSALLQDTGLNLPVAKLTQLWRTLTILSTMTC